jgi:hypothetical protein
MSMKAVIRKPARRVLLSLIASALVPWSVAAFNVPPVSAQVPSPRSVLGFHPTDDRTIADWSQITDYFGRLDKASNKVAIREIGKTTNGRRMIAAFISSAGNIKKLDKYREISARLADPRTVKSDSQMESLIKEGKTIVSISCSIHSTEIVASQMSMNLAYELATARDADTNEILEKTILILIPSSNPDGVDIVASWYRKTLGTKSEGTSPPELYHHYAGHDNNRDWFMLNLEETRAITKLFWKEWFPQLVYDVHQQGQQTPRFVIPPFFDPPNPRLSPSILREVGLIGYKMAADLQAAGVTGVATNASYDTWWHGGFRSAPYFHNSIGLLSEASSADLMSPVTINREDLAKARPTRGLKSLLDTATNFPTIWNGGQWRPADIARIEMIAARGLLQMAAKFRPRYLRNFYEYGRENLNARADEPQAFIITAGQPQAARVSRLLEILMAQGIEVHEMTRELHVKNSLDAKEYQESPLGSFLIFVDQPQKNNILSLFERQVYPHRLTESGEAEVPYDVAGWTLPMQMGVDYEAAWQIQDIGKNIESLRPVKDINSARSVMNLPRTTREFAKQPNPLNTSPRIGLYKGYPGSMDEGWTRFVFDTFQIPFKQVTDRELRSGNLDLDTIILPADSEESIVKGLGADKYPAGYTGGIGEKGVESLKSWVRSGGTLICFDDSCALAIKHFGLPVKNVLTGLKRSEFYNPGSVVQLEVDTSSPIARGMTDRVPAYFINSSAFETTAREGVTTIARYAAKDALLSGWMLGEKFMNGKAALVEASYGKGRVVMFGFRPQHRGQTWGTFQFIFNAVEKR